MPFWATISSWMNSVFPPEVVQDQSRDTNQFSDHENKITEQASDESYELPPTDESVWWKPQEQLVTQEPRLPKPSTTNDHISEKKLLSSLEASLNDPNIDLPRLPLVAEQVLTLTRNPNCSMRQIAQLTCQDQVLSAGLLRQANSVAYGGLHKITALDGALTRLGMRGIRSAMIRESVKNLTITTSGAALRGKQLWEQSLASASVMAIYADCFSTNTDDAFMIGLLHDIGKVVVLRSCSEVGRTTTTQISDEIFEYYCQEFHEMMGEMLADLWHLPTEIATAIAQHHGPLQSDDQLLTHKALVQLTDVTVSILGYGPAVNYDLLETPAAIHLGAPDNQAFLESLEVIPEAVELSLRDL